MIMANFAILHADIRAVYQYWIRRSHEVDISHILVYNFLVLSFTAQNLFNRARNSNEAFGHIMLLSISVLVHMMRGPVIETIMNNT